MVAVVFASKDHCNSTLFCGRLCIGWIQNLGSCDEWPLCNYNIFNVGTIEWINITPFKRQVKTSNSCTIFDYRIMLFLHIELFQNFVNVLLLLRPIFHPCLWISIFCLKSIDQLKIDPLRYMWGSCNFIRYFCFRVYLCGK